jgi:hypothetical protein
MMAEWADDLLTATKAMLTAVADDVAVVGQTKMSSQDQ